MKKLINAPQQVVREQLEGMALAHPDLLRVSFDPDYVARAAPPTRGKVALVSGGGSGHEPLHCGFVGYGMLDAACPGAVFTSPVPDQMLAASKAVDGGAGVLHIVKNYTGDVLNFELAAELLQAEGIAVASVVLNDDVAVQDSLFTAGRRGVGATVLAEKICGAAAEAGMPLAELQRLCERVRDQSRSMGVALSSCIVPEKGSPTFELSDHEIEMGIGIHGEPGIRRMEHQPVHEIVATLASAVLSDLPFLAGDRVLALVNGMGGTPLSELYIVYKELSAVCSAHGVSIERSLVGSYITSLEMAGASITLLRIDDTLLRWWDAPVHTPALRWGM